MQCPLGYEQVYLNEGRPLTPRILQTTRRSHGSALDATTQRLVQYETIKLGLSCQWYALSYDYTKS